MVPNRALSSLTRRQARARATRMLLCPTLFLALCFPRESTGQVPGASGKKFSIPVWHPDARWTLDPRPYALDTNCHAAQLDGPRHEIMVVQNIMPRFFGGFTGGGRYTFVSLDERTDRMHAVTGGTPGLLDGPFARARLYVDDYHTTRHERAWSADQRFFYFLASFYGQRIRSLDFAEQMVRTVPVKGLVFACGESGKLYVVEDSNPAKAIHILSPGPEWKLLRTIALHGGIKLEGLGTSLAVDEKHGRLYGTTYRATPWYVWYWDLSDGKVHGVLPNCQGKPNARQSGEAGPFEGTVLYNHGEISWGPDDPDKRFLYVTRVDDFNLYRLDLERKVMAVFSVKQGRFVEQGKGDGNPLYMYPPHWLPDGSFVGVSTWYDRPPQYKLFRRTR